MDCQSPAAPLANLCVNTIKLLAIEGVQKAKSGHPGLPMGLADVTFVLWSRFLNFNPEAPGWMNRDRFILSAGHGSMLLYSLLHLFGFDLSLDDLQKFRQWESRTPGHPEFGLTAGVETTTGPLGQGFANGVGLAIAQKMWQARLNLGASPLLNHKIYACVSDGDLMEGVASEAASSAGHLQLNNLIYIYDANQITIEGKTQLTFSEDVARRFQAYNWQTLSINGHDHAAITAALQQAQAEAGRPTLIIAHTHIANGSPNFQDSAAAHGSPLGAEEIALIKEKVNWPADRSFWIPPEVQDYFRGIVAQRKSGYQEWQEKFHRWRNENPDLWDQWQQLAQGDLPEDLEQQLLAVIDDQALATRVQSGKVIQKIAKLMPGFCGGSADLAPSNNTFIKSGGEIQATDFSGRNFHFGVREHAMGAILNGLSLYGGLIPYGGTFLVFSDYVRPAIRLAALMQRQVIYIFTHDSIFVGEDGPTHQPIEHLAALQLIPNLTVFRPADGAETAAAWGYALRHRTGPTALVLTRQNLPPIHTMANFDPAGMGRGYYLLTDVPTPDLVLLASGSEVSVALKCRELLAAKGLQIRVISVPCLKLFLRQPAAVRDALVPPTGCQLVALEVGVSDLWYAIVGKTGLVLGIDHFGASAPASVLAEKFGFTPTLVAEKIWEHRQAVGEIKSKLAF
ncbi:transketolase [candidate division KSB1 bacterium]|nr:transketolase [candidate division KSB1 bacterium]